MLLALAAGCAEAPPPPVAPRVDLAERPYLLPPASGFPGQLDAGLGAALAELHRRLLTEGATPRLAGEAAALAAERPQAAPVQVLLSQIDAIGGDRQRARDRLEPLTGALPGYDAALLLYGRLSELASDLPPAFEAYRQIADRLPLAAERIAELRPRVLEIVANRLSAAIGAGELDGAAAELERLESWAPGAIDTLQAARRLAAARRDARTELATLRELRRRLPDDGEVRDRLATLEVAVGDPGAGISLLQEIAAERPDDIDVQARLRQARFRWRLVLLPTEVRRLTRAPELSRSEVAALVYWLFPTVRYARPQNARIANDVFDHPFREEIVRVINLDMMEVDRDLHQFEPTRAATRAEMLAAVLRVIGAVVPGQPCLGATVGRERLSWPIACAAGAACGLIPEEADCLPAATLSGAEAVEICRRAQLLLGGE